MTEKTKILFIVIAKISIAILVIVSLLGLLFRSTLYWAIPVAQNQSMGGGDVIVPTTH